MIKDINPELAAIIQTGTDPDVVSRYASLAERARAYDFGLLEDDVVIVDTETTGLDFKECELIEVAAARLRGREVVATFDEFVKPASPIPAEIVAITGIDNDMVADADDAATVVGRLIEFAQDTPIIAHNSAFDRHFVEKGNGGAPLGNVWVDSLEFSRIVLPCLTSHKLHDLSRAFDLHQSTHRAIDDVIATCGLWRVLLTAASDLPAGLLNALSRAWPSVAWTYRPIFAQLAASAPQAPFSLVDERAQRCSKTSCAPRVDAFELREQGIRMRFPTPEAIAEEYAVTGVVGAMYDSYEPRAEQVEMAGEVARAFRGSGHLAVEAGTGVGKSIAYLLPAAALAQANQVTVGIATKSNALADQLINRELPLLSKALDKPLTFTALKGFDNYPCLRKVEALLQAGLTTRVRDREEADKGPQGSEELLEAIAAIMAYSVQSAGGDLNCLGIRWGKVQRADLSSSSSECQRRRCPYFPNKCFLHLARRRAAACDVVVTNHSLLFCQAGNDVDVLPPIRYWVVDEAHSAEAEARHQWAQRVNSGAVRAVFDVMGGSTTGALGSLMGAARAAEGSTLLMGLLSKTASECARASIAAGMFFDDVKGFCKRQNRGKSSSFDTQTIWIDAPLRASDSFAKVAASGRSLANILERAVACAKEALASLSEASSPDQGLADRATELTSATNDLAQLHRALSLCVEGTDERYVYSACATQRTGFETYELAAELVDVGAELAQTWYPSLASVVFSSATIAVGDGFEHFAHGVGLDRLPSGSWRGLRLDSSYDFERNMRVVVAQGLPDPTKEKEAYLAALAPLLVDIHLAMGGSVLTLFTNRAEMEAMYDIVAPQLACHGLELAGQLRGANVRRLREHFIAETTSSLFALKSFWEGFDASGDTLRCVVIPRLPFTPPTDPLSQERKLREGAASWRNHDLPESVLATKQAAGRLIRSSTDTGVLVLADPRLTTMWYGKVFLASLPKRTWEGVPVRDVGDDLRRWCEGMEGRR